MRPITESAKKHLEDLLTFFGVNTSVDAHQQDDRIELFVDADDSGHLIGHRGETLSSLQHILNMIIRRETDERVYVHIDIGGYRKARLERLEARTHEVVTKVAGDGEEVMLPPMTPAERRHIHSLLSDHESVVTESRGEGTRRRLVIKKR
jgi:spoIIIJ-associated protein